MAVYIKKELLATEEAKALKDTISQLEALEHELSKAVGREQLSKARCASKLREKKLRLKNGNHKVEGKLRLEKEIRALEEELPALEKAFADATEKYRQAKQEREESQKSFDDTFYAIG